APLLLGFLEKNIKEKFPGRDIAHISVSHWHPDHSGGIGHFAPNAKVIAHANVKKTLLAKQKGYGLAKAGVLLEFEAREAKNVPNTIFDKRHEVILKNEKMIYTHLPNAHTDGDIIAHFERSNVIHVGDLVWPRSFPFVDYYNGGTAPGILAAIDRLLKISDENTTFVPGHGEVFDRQYLSKYREMVFTTIEIVRSKTRKKLSAEKIRSDGLPSFRDWATPLVSEAIWIEMILKSPDTAN
ncbi:MAG: MBL fold metallo-hydrolase, partial [Pyrinomonadaceae bacterium]